MSDTYILQVNLPDRSITGNRYMKDSTGYFYMNIDHQSDIGYPPSMVENNPAFFRKKESPTNVIKVYATDEYIIECHNPREATVVTSVKVHGATISESINWFLTRPAGSIYSQQDIDNARKEAFNESRLTHPIIGFKHDTYEDYLKSINK